ncbi:MAG TPA: J domain-containing protein, partial [Burkholderiaceae bacterium]|nr:J domain-containing protein [Burkholderiaceae bacterium]
MAKIHTHYDNLKVARKAPQEVIRAAYKALSQKYHPDKNPGDEKAARIMAILNSAY